MLGACLLAARLNCRVAQSPVDALIDLRVGYRLRCQIPTWLEFYILTHQHITVGRSSLLYPSHSWPRLTLRSLRAKSVLT